MIPSRGRPNTARLNYNHMMIENNQVSAYILTVFVCPDEFEDYKKVWEGHCALVKLNDTQPDIEENVYNGGIGFSRRFIQRFASWYDIKYFFMADDNIVYLSALTTYFIVSFSRRLSLSPSIPRQFMFSHVALKLAKKKRNFQSKFVG